MSKHVLLAIDPGASGGIAWMDDHICNAVTMPATHKDIIDVIIAATRLRKTREGGTAFLEDLVKHMGPGIPASTMAVYASNWGIIKGALLALGWRTQVVRPQEWQKGLGLGITGRQKANCEGMTPSQAKAEKIRIGAINANLKRMWKNKLKGHAQDLFPNIAVTLDTADALLLLEYGRTQI